MVKETADKRMFEGRNKVDPYSVIKVPKILITISCPFRLLCVYLINGHTLRRDSSIITLFAFF